MIPLTNIDTREWLLQPGLFYVNIMHHRPILDTATKSVRSLMVAEVGKCPGLNLRHTHDFGFAVIIFTSFMSSFEKREARGCLFIPQTFILFTHYLLLM